MTPDQEKRLIGAFNNISELLPEKDFVAIIEQTIALFNGKAGELKEEPPMPPKGYKKGPKKTDSVQQTNLPTQSSVAVPFNKEQVITEWKQAVDVLADVKAKEHALRQTLVSHLFDGNKLEGSESVDVGYDYQLRAVKELAYNATDKNGETKALLALLQLRDPALADGLIRWQPDVAKKVYKQVLALAEQYQDNEVLAALHAAITIKPGMPQLELVPPKQDAPISTEAHINFVEKAPVAEVLPPSAPVPTWSPAQAVIEEDFLPE